MAFFNALYNTIVASPLVKGFQHPVSNGPTSPSVSRLSTDSVSIEDVSAVLSTLLDQVDQAVAASISDGVQSDLDEYEDAEDSLSVDLQFSENLHDLHRSHIQADRTDTARRLLDSRSDELDSEIGILLRDLTSFIDSTEANNFEIAAAVESFSGHYAEELQLSTDSFDQDSLPAVLDKAGSLSEIGINKYSAELSFNLSSSSVASVVEEMMETAVDSDPPILPKGAYNIDWDNIDNIDPFKTITRPSSKNSPKKLPVVKTGMASDDGTPKPDNNSNTNHEEKPIEAAPSGPDKNKNVPLKVERPGDPTVRSSPPDHSKSPSSQKSNSPNLSTVNTSKRPNDGKSSPGGKQSSSSPSPAPNLTKSSSATPSPPAPQQQTTTKPATTTPPTAAGTKRASPPQPQLTQNPASGSPSASVVEPADDAHAKHPPNAPPPPASADTSMDVTSRSEDFSTPPSGERPSGAPVASSSPVNAASMEQTPVKRALDFAVADEPTPTAKAPPGDPDTVKRAQQPMQSSPGSGRPPKSNMMAVVAPMQQKASSPPTDGETFVPASADIFDDPAALDALGSKNTDYNAMVESDLYRQSLYTNFDPVTQKASQEMQQQMKSKSNPSSSSPEALSSIRDDLSNDGDDLLSMETPKPSGTVKKKQLHSVQAQKQGVDRLLDLTPVSTVQKGETPEAVEKRVSAFWKSQLEAKEAEFNKVLQQKEMELVNKRQSVEQLGTVIAEYEKTIRQTMGGGGISSSMTSSRMISSITSESLDDVVRQRDQALEDLAGVESSFADLHRRYEKSKQTIEEQKKNEDSLKQKMSDSLARLRKQDDRLIKLRDQAEEKLARANDEIERLQALRETDTLGLRAQLKKHEVQIESLERTLEQKTRETSELTSICDELIQKAGKSSLD